MILSAVGFPTRRGYDSLDRLENRVAATLVALRFASAIGAPMVINQIGRIPAERRDTAGKHFFEAMDAIGREAERVGVRFAIETGADGPETLGKFLAEQANHGLAVNYDPANLLVRGHNVYNGVAALVHHIIGLHVKDAVRTGTTVSGFQEVPLGEGELDWPQLFNLLDEVGYRGVYTIERESGDQRERDIIRAVEYLRKF
jgi:sugar phosphate isomerase/epimerase